MSTWIESHDSLRDHPKTRKLARRLDVSRAAVIGHLQMLWWWAVTYAPKGDLSRYDAEDIALAADWDGEPEAFVRGLVEVGWLDEDPLRIHDWDDYAGRLIARREADAERKRLSRSGTTPGRAQDVQRTSGGHPTPVQRTEPNRTEPNPTDSADGDGDDHDGLWSAMEALYGEAPTTKRLRTAFAGIVRDLRTEGATADEVTRLVRVARDDRRLTFLVSTPASLLKHLPVLRTEIAPAPVPEPEAEPEPVDPKKAAQAKAAMEALLKKKGVKRAS